MAWNDNVVYDNFVLENKFKDILETKLDAIKFMTVDTDLQGVEGMKKTINTYTYEGAVEAVAEGATNTTRGKVTFADQDYEVKVKQQVFDYTDEQAMKDKNVVEVGIKGSATEMVNDLNNDFFTEIARTSTLHTHTGALSYDVIVDAIEKMNIEDETGLFLLIGTDLKAQIRKDADFKASRLGEMLYHGQIGDICGVPVAVSKKVPKNTAYLATKEAVTVFIKKGTEIEQSRDANTRKNEIFARKYMVVALTDDTRVIRLVRP